MVLMSFRDQRESVFLVWSKEHVYLQANPQEAKKDGFLGILLYSGATYSPFATAKVIWISANGPPNLVKAMLDMEGDICKQIQNRYDEDISSSDQQSESEGGRNEPKRLCSPSSTVSVESDSSKSVSALRRRVLLPKSLPTDSICIAAKDIKWLTLKPPISLSQPGSILITMKKDAHEQTPRLYFNDNECRSTLAEARRRARNFDPFGKQHDTFWGGVEFVTVLKQFVRVERKQRNLLAIDPIGDTPSFCDIDLNDKPARKLLRIPGSSLKNAIKEAKWSLFEKFSRVTNLGKQTAQEILQSEPINDIMPLLPPRLRQVIDNKQVQEITEEYDPARIYLAKWASVIAKQGKDGGFSEIDTIDDIWDEQDSIGQYLKIRESEELISRGDLVSVGMWDSFFDDQKHLVVTVKEVKGRIFKGTIAKTLRKEAWKFLLGFYDWNSLGKERIAYVQDKREEFYLLKNKWRNEVEHKNESENFKEQKFRIEKDVHRTDRHIDLFSANDLSHPESPDGPFEMTNIHMEICKDILLTYNEYNPSLEYVQGMSDLLTPIYYVMQNDADTFWCFCNLMEIMQKNFFIDQSGMSKQLDTLSEVVKFMDPKLHQHLNNCDSLNFFFMYRMLLIRFKRDFEFDKLLQLWDVLFTNYLSSHFHIFVALAILESQRDFVIENLKKFDEILKYFNDLSMNIELDDILILAEKLFYKFRALIAAVDNYEFGTESKKKVFIDSEADRKDTLSRRTEKIGQDFSFNDNKAENDDMKEAFERRLEKLSVTDNLRSLLDEKYQV